MPVLQFKGKTAVENYHHTVPHHQLEFDAKLSLLVKDEKPSLDGNFIIEGDNLLGDLMLLPNLTLYSVCKCPIALVNLYTICYNATTLAFHPIVL